MTVDFIRSRITELRLQKDVSEHKMSLDLGHTRSYIHNIVSGQVLPSMTEFLYICEYFNITPSQFFTDNESLSLLLTKIINECKKLSDDDQQMILSIIKRMQA